MKLKKLLASILCVAMVLGTMSFTAFAADIQGPYILGIDDKGRETIKVDIYEIAAYENFTVKLFDDETPISTTVLRQTDRDDESNKLYPLTGVTTVNIVLGDKTAGSWDTEWHTTPNASIIPNKIEAWADGKLVDTWEGTMSDKYITTYKAYENVEKVAKIGDEVYGTLQEALNSAGAAGAGSNTIEILTDIDLTGVEWTPVKVDGYHGADIVTVNGNGMTITGLSAPLFAGGFAGGSGIVINDLTILDSDIVSTNTQGSGAFVECADSMDEITLTNCHLIESTLSGSRTGGLVGWTAGYNNVNDGPVKSYITIKDCSVKGCEINATGSVGAIIGHSGGNAWTFTKIGNCTIEDNIITSTDEGDWRAGIVVGTANVGEQVIDNITEKGNTVSQTGKTMPEGQTGLIGRFVPGTTGTLVIDGVPYTENSKPYPVNVNGVTYFKTIKEAVDVAVDGDVITVSAGEYNESIIIGKAITLKGEDKDTTTITSLDNNDGIRVAANGNVTISNLTVNGKDDENPGFERAAIIVTGGATGTVTIENCNINAGGDSGITVETGNNANLVINNNVFGGKTFVGDYVADASGFGEQFSKHNVPRQAVVVNRDASATSTVTFTGNVINTIVGGEYAPGAENAAKTGMYNTGVTIDGPGVEVTGNTFNVAIGESGSSWSSALRVGKDTEAAPATVSGNDFSGLGNMIYARANSHSQVANNTTDGKYLLLVGTAAAGQTYVATNETPVAVNTTIDVAYWTLQDAIDAAQENDTITILAGTYNAFTVPMDKNNLTFIGETDAEGNNLVTIRTLEDDVDTNTRGICVQPETATFKNLNITAGTSVNRGGWMTSSLGNTNGDTGLRSNLKVLNVENVNFTGSGVYSAVWMNNGSVNFVNSTVDNYQYGVYVYAVKDDQVVNVTGSELSTTNRAVFNQEGTVNGKVNVTNSVIDAPMLTVGAGVPATFTGNDISNVSFYIYGETEMTNNSLVDCEYNTSSNGVINLSENYVNNVNDIVDMALSENVNFTSYYGTEEDLANKENLVTVKEKADNVYVQYKKVDVDVNGDDTVEGSDKYEIVLAGADAEKINELASADLTFNFVGTPVNGGAMSYTVLPAEGVSLSQIGDRFMFNYDGVTKYEETGAAIVIGTITIDGYGSYTLATNSEVTTNAVYATKIADDIVDGFTPAAGLVINSDMTADDGMVGEITDGAITVPTRTLTVNVTFPNAVNANAVAYQDMKVEITGNIEGENKTVTYDLGAMVNGAYEVVETKLVLNNAYTVTVSGAGYRTARYTVTMTEDKELNFWNNVMDNALEIEEGKASSAVTKNFLAGDIVKDNNINIYDLSAVVSYFGTENLVSEHPEYAKYDLNRDGVIDSKDVAYVLVSWGE